jgi:hypothetical protein
MNMRGSWRLLECFGQRFQVRSEISVAELITHDEKGAAPVECRIPIAG